MREPWSTRLLRRMRSYNIATGSVVVAVRQQLHTFRELGKPNYFFILSENSKAYLKPSSTVSIHTHVFQLSVLPPEKYTIVIHMITMSTPCCARRSKSASLKALEVKQGEEAAQDRGLCRGWWDVGDGGGCQDELGKSVFFFWGGSGGRCVSRILIAGK